MGRTPIPEAVYSRKFTIVTVGPVRTEAEVRSQVDEALKEALSESKHKSKMSPKAEPDGALFGAGIDWHWILHVLPDAKTAIDAVLVGALGKAGAQLFESFVNKLKSKNILVQGGPAETAPAAKPERPRKKSASVSTKKLPQKKKATDKKGSKSSSARKK